MLQLDYTLDSSWNRIWSETGLEQADEGTLRYDCFLGDVVIIVDNVDLSARWGWVPVLDFALAIEAIITVLESRSDREVFEFTESDATIFFRRTDDTVELEAPYAAGVARVPYTDLRAATTQFLARMLEDLVRDQPALRKNSLIKSHLGQHTRDSDT